MLFRGGGGGAIMKKAHGFKTQPSMYSIGIAPTSRARCRLCRQRVDKGEVRIVTHAFVRPGRRHNFVSHARCATLALLNDMVSVYGTIRCVPKASGMGGEVYDWACEQLERIGKRA